MPWFQGHTLDLRCKSFQCLGGVTTCGIFDLIIWVFINQYIVEMCCQGIRIQWTACNFLLPGTVFGCREFPLSKLAKDWDFLFWGWFSIHLFCCLYKQIHRSHLFVTLWHSRKWAHKDLWKENLGQSFQYSIKGMILNSTCWYWLGCSHLYTFHAEHCAHRGLARPRFLRI